jgi:hypothetical protein
MILNLRVNEWLPPAFLLAKRAGENTARSEVANDPIALQTLCRSHRLEAVALAHVLAFAAMLRGFAIAVAFAIMDVVTMYFVLGSNGRAARAFGGVSSESVC